VHCNTTLWNERVSLFPETEEAYEEMVRHWTEVSQSCLNLTRLFLAYVDTASAVKDYEVVRVALGNESINMVGYSYGAQFGAQYAEFFPRNIRAMVLDGVLDHRQASLLYSWQTESKSFEGTLDQFFDWCESNSTCALHNETDIPAYFDQLVDNANATPMSFDPEGRANSSCRQYVTGYDIVNVVQELLISPNGEGPSARDPGFPGWQDYYSLPRRTIP
jgi:pimeloyl-ACP methyl ester carboxylesterase